MKIVDLAQRAIDLPHLLELAQAGPVVVLTPDGREYVLAEANDLEQEVEQLRNSVAFQAFLAERSAQNKPRVPFEHVMREIGAGLAAEASRTP